MSLLTDFIKSLAPHIKKATVQRELDSTLKELTTLTMPMVKNMADTTSASPLKNDFMKVFESHIRDNLNFSRKGGNIWIDLYAALVNVQANGEAVKKLVDELLQEDTLRDGITVRSAQLIRLAGAISFVNTFTAEVTDYSLAQEAVKMGDADATPPAQARHIREALPRYAQLLKDVAMPPKEFSKLLSDVPDAYIKGGKSDLVHDLFTPKQIDPFGAIKMAQGWTGSPIFAARMMWESYQAERFHAMKERKNMMELRLLHLENMRANSPNPRLQAEIEGLQARINKYDRKIREVEASL